MSKIELVFAETSPFESVEAVIEQDDQVAYFYLRGVNDDGRFGMKSCWIRNLIDAPEQLDRNRMTAGLPPALPAEFCKFNHAQNRLDEKDLRVVWFEEGDGASLFENDSVIATIPAKPGQLPDSSGQFDGYSLECAKDSPFCGPLPEQGSPLIRRIERANQFWKSWQTEQSPWMEYEPKILAAYESLFGETVSYFAIDGGKWPPRTLAKYHWKDRIILLSVGVSICSQPGIELYSETPESLRRFEWGACFDRSLPDDLIEAFGRYLGGQVAIPWQKLVFFANGHSVGCEFFQNSSALPDYSSILLYDNRDCILKTEAGENWEGIPKVLGDPVNLYWTLPVFEKERKFIQETSNYSFVHDLVAEDGLPTIRVRRTQI